MTTIASPAGTSRRTGRILAVTRLHFVNRFQIVWLPLMILGFILLVNIAIWAIIVAASGETPGYHPHEHFEYSGAVFYIYIYSMVIAVQAVSRTFPFALGFGATRRDFSLGTGLAFVLLSAFFSIVLTVMSVTEIATNGWGYGGRLFAPAYFTASDLAARFVIYFATFLFTFFIGSIAASAFVRWRALGLIGFFALVIVILIAIPAFITLAGVWIPVDHAIGGASTLGLALGTLPLSAIAAVAGYLTLRKATPKN